MNHRASTEGHGGATADSPPVPNPDNRGFWDGCRRGELRLQRCTRCGVWRHHPRPICPACRSFDYEWALASGRGVVHTFTIVHRPTLPAFEAQLPYNVIVVRLEEGPFMVSNLIDYAARRPAHRPAGGGGVRAVGRRHRPAEVPAAAGRMMQRVWLLALLLGAAPALAADDVVARVNGVPITEAMVNAVVKGTISGRAQPPSQRGDRQAERRRARIADRSRAAATARRRSWASRCPTRRSTPRSPATGRVSPTPPTTTRRSRAAA